MARIFHKQIIWGPYETFSFSEVFLGVSSIFGRNLVKGKYTGLLEKKFTNYFGAKGAYGFGGGRMALYLLLKSAGLRKDDEVLLTNYTCVVVPGAVVYAGLKPVYADVKGYNIDLEKVEKEITKKTKVWIIQHTYGIPVDMEKAMRIARKHKLIVIEDCAHVIGGEFNGKKLGTFGDAAFFSFESSKVISTVEGGMAIVNSSKLNEEMKKFYSGVSYPSKRYVKNRLINLFRAILNSQRGYLLKRIMEPFFYRARVFFAPTTKEDCAGVMKKEYPFRLTNGLAKVGLRQFEKLDKMNKHRREIARLYNHAFSNINSSVIEESYLLRYPLIVENKEKVMNKMLEKNIELGGWFEGPIHPYGTDCRKFGYSKEESPVSEGISKKVINLPIGPRVNKRDAIKIIRLLKKLI